MGQRIKQVDGVRVLYRYNAPLFFTGLFNLVMAACSLLLIWFPIMTFKYDGVNYTMNVFNGWGSFLFWLPQFYEMNPIFQFAAANVDAYFVPVVTKFVLFGLIIFMGLAAIFDAILALAGLWFILVGKSNTLGANKVFAGLSFSMHLTSMIVAVLLGVYVMIIGKLGGLEITFDCLWLYVYAGASFLANLFITIIYKIFFKTFVWNTEIGELRRSDASNPIDEDIVVDHVAVATETLVRYQYAKGLPSNLSHIGGHAFSFNTILEEALIPHGISSIGVGAFSNCLNLKLVSIPKSVKKIEANAFFNCAGLKRINYAGTKKDWRKIKRGSNWLLKAGTVIVNCVDGPITVDPNK